MNHPQTFRPNSYQRSLRNQKRFARLQMFSAPLVMVVLGIPAFLFYMANKDLPSPTVTAEPQITQQAEVTKPEPPQTEAPQPEVTLAEVSENGTTETDIPLSTPEQTPVPDATVVEQTPVSDATVVEESAEIVSNDTPVADPITTSKNIPKDTTKIPDAPLSDTPVVQTASVQQERIKLNLDDPVAMQLKDTYDALKADIQQGEELLEIKRTEARLLEEKLATAKALLASLPVDFAVDDKTVEVPDSTTSVVAAVTVVSEVVPVSVVVPIPPIASPVTTDGSLLLDELWLATQNADQFVVQIASSTDFAALVDFVLEIQSDEPKAIYPFQTTNQDQLVYGASIGLYSSRNEAIEEANTLSAKEGLFGTWVRQIKEITEQVDTAKGLN